MDEVEAIALAKRLIKNSQDALLVVKSEKTINWLRRIISTSEEFLQSRNN